MKDVASEVLTYRGIQSQVASGESTAINGFTINRRGFYSAICRVEVGNTSGTPTRFGVTFQIQEKSGESAWADVTDALKTFSGESVATQAQQYEIPVDLRSREEYIRVKATPTFTAGSSPAIEIAANWILGESDHGAV